MKISYENYWAISEPIVSSKPETIATNTLPIFQGTSKKGIQGIAYSSYDGRSDIVDARNANTKYTVLNLDFASVVTTDPKKDGYKEYTYKGNIHGSSSDGSWKDLK